MSHRQISASQDPAGNALPEELAGEIDPITADASWLNSLTSQTPWWVVSVLFHGLLILFVGMLSITINTGESEELVDIVGPSPAIGEFKEKHETPPAEPKGSALVPARFDPSKPESDIYVSEEFKRHAVEGNEFMTFDPGIVAELEGARGNLDAKMIFHSSDPTGKPGGSGGNGSVMLEQMIGAGAANAGSGDGRFFGDGDGIGIQKGSGKASFGRRNAASKRAMVRPYNPRGTGGILPATDSALQWLAYHQEADGHWDTKKYGASNKNDTAISSLALLAFLGSGHSEKVGEFKDNIKRGVAWLIQHQRADGMIADDTDDQATHRKGGYPMAIATLALCEAAAMAQVQTTHDAAQKAVDYCVNLHQAGEGSDKMGWRYGPKMEGDLSVSGWFIMALKSAKIGGLHVDPAAFDGAQRFLESVEIKDKNLDTGYGPVSRFKYMANNEHAQTAHRLTAIGTLARQFMGWKKEELQGSVDWFLEKGGYPQWGGNGEKVDLYYWYYGSMAVFQQGEPQFGKWSHAMLDALLPNQRKTGDENGSWDPAGEYSSEWGRVGQTALSALCLEVYYRYPKLNK